jgi:hypothetical protein
MKGYLHNWNHFSKVDQSWSIVDIVLPMYNFLFYDLEYLHMTIRKFSTAYLSVIKRTLEHSDKKFNKLLVFF